MFDYVECYTVCVSREAGEANPSLLCPPLQSLQDTSRWNCGRIHVAAAESRACGKRGPHKHTQTWKVYLKILAQLTFSENKPLLRKEKSADILHFSLSDLV